MICKAPAPQLGAHVSVQARRCCGFPPCLHWVLVLLSGFPVSFCFFIMVCSFPVFELFSFLSHVFLFALHLCTVWHVKCSCKFQEEQQSLAKLLYIYYSFVKHAKQVSVVLHSLRNARNTDNIHICATSGTPQPRGSEVLHQSQTPTQERLQTTGKCK